MAFSCSPPLCTWSPIVIAVERRVAEQINNRKRYQTLLAVGKRELGWDDDTYRLFLAHHGATIMAGKYSALTMSVGQLVAAVEAMKAKGFTIKKRSAPWRQPRIDKITAIWIALFDAGIVHDRSERAMVKWCAGITKKARLEWASGMDLNNCIEGLKAWAMRERVKLHD